MRIAMATAQAAREVDRKVLEGWINLEGEDFEAFVRNVCQWSIENGDTVVIPVNNDNEAKTTVTRETVKFDRKFFFFLTLAGLAWASRWIANFMCVDRVLKTNKESIRTTCMKGVNLYTLINLQTTPLYSNLLPQ